MKHFSGRHFSRQETRRRVREETLFPRATGAAEREIDHSTASPVRGAELTPKFATAVKKTGRVRPARHLANFFKANPSRSIGPERPASVERGVR